MQSVGRDSHQLNEYVRDKLAPYLSGNYQLSEAGQKMVIEANEKLDHEYAEAHKLPIANWCFRDIRSRLNALPPKSYDRVLDVCAGTGYVSLNVMSHSLFKECVALDINPSALRLLEQQARDLKISGILTSVGNIMKTEFPANHFDCILGNAFLHHLPDNKTFLAEMCRILKPGGVICILGEPGLSAIKWQNLFQRFILSLVGKKHWPKGEIPLTDIWQFERHSLQALLAEVGFSESKVVGHGRWSVAVGMLLDRLWVRFTKRTAPAWIWWISYAMNRTGDFFIPKADPNVMAGISISARK